MADAIVLNKISKSFVAADGRVFAVRDLSLQVKRGEFVTIIGPSGCGKSTTLRLICGLEDIDAGEISVFGETAQAARSSKRFGFVFQDATLLPWLTVQQNVRFAARLANSKDYSVEGALSDVGLDGMGRRYPHQLSGGQRQRAAIARALVFDPPVLLMDEPFSALDESTREGLQDLLSRLWERTGKTVVYVTHNTQEAVYLSQRVLVFSNAPGQIKADIGVDLPAPRNSALRDSVALVEQARKLRLLLG